MGGGREGRLFKNLAKIAFKESLQKHRGGFNFWLFLFEFLHDDMH
jgi:hypothetical protein